MTATRISVNVPGSAYDVIIDPGLLGQLGPLVHEVAPSRSALLVVDKRIASTHGRAALTSLQRAGIEPIVVELAAEETQKTIETAQQLFGAMLGAGLDRSSPVIALGGGIIGDTAGFVAATYMRGVPLIQVPTTLLAMVDAAIGGKTGVNFPLPGGGLGKNMVGAFWQPKAVVVDPQVLGTLDARDFRCGLAECVKGALIADASLLQFLTTEAPRILALDQDAIRTLIERCVRIKAEIVAADERESGRRALLNLGHTFAHAIESIPQLKVRHGEAVSIGLMAAAHCAVKTGRLTADQHEQIEKLLTIFGLPIRLPSPVDEQRLLAAMRYDKKATQGRTRLILPSGVGRAELVGDVPGEVVAAGWAGVGASVVPTA